ncbi:efflux RND transporter periplasmic adaptor subunit [Portibacter lacus]|uniref:Multidrug resistance protein MdtA-like barrel-sandwich hybrid domain-containing protein n=1 Tax=Portibacter lacus TaxID=1099794 RepID=A0AA37SPE5_9BACT|nr:efflux RND transporter periplasmic adaptor subunit [Portibacter lacus]GLR17612.1 hypothetical protein GCM10007940_22270 [Portibacter lacus]
MAYTYKLNTALAFIILVSACNQNPTDTDMEETMAETTGITLEKKQFDSSKFKLGKVEEQDFTKIINATGSLDIPEKNTAAVSTLMSGTIGSINIIEGEWVRKGQQLFTITNPEIINMQEEFLIADSQLEYLQEEYNRQIDLQRENLSTKKDLLKAKSELHTTQAKHGALRKKLNLYGINTNQLTINSLVSTLKVAAPISGYITHIDAIQGMFLEPNETALKIANASHIHLELSVLEKDALLLKKEQPLTFTLQGNPDKKYHATIHLINRSINEKHMITIHCHIEDDSNQSLVPGMYANAEILIDEYRAKALPEDALVKMNEVYYGMMLRSQDDAGMIFDKKSIEVGAQQNGFIEIKEALDPEIEFLINGAYYLIQ